MKKPRSVGSTAGLVFNGVEAREWFTLMMIRCPPFQSQAFRRFRPLM